MEKYHISLFLVSGCEATHSLFWIFFFSQQFWHAQAKKTSVNMSQGSPFLV